MAWQETVALSEFRGSERFVLLRRLGAGGMGVVFEALDQERQTKVALKALRPLDEHSLYRFKNEFRALADIRHPNLVRLGELHREGEHWFFTMELVEGSSLLAYLWRQHSAEVADADTVRGRPLSASQARRARIRVDERLLRQAFGQLAAATAAIHGAGLIHRDIKPSNILVTREGRTVLLDFGLVTEIVADRQQTDVSVVGSADYMAPEQAAGRWLGPPADWYSVGAVLYQALTGVLPFQGTGIEVMLAKQRSEPTPPRALVPSVPADLDALCTALLSCDPKARPRGPEVLASLGNAELDSHQTAAVRTAPRGPFVGRLKELAGMCAALEDSRRTGVTLLINGESGLGKSALVRRFVECLQEDDETAIVLAGRCYEREHLAYKAFDGIIDALCRHLAHMDPMAAALLLPDDAALLARVFPVLRRIPAMAQVPEPIQQLPNPQEIRARAFAALRQLLTKLARRQPLVLFIDDFQWADADSLALLGDVMHTPDAPQLLLIATVRTGGEGHGSLPVMPALSQLRQLHLGPLSAGESRQLVSMLAPGTSKKSGDVIAKEAGGHPMFIQELVQHTLAADGRALGAVALDDALWSRIERLERPARQLLEVIAIAGSPLPQRLVAQAANLTAAAFADAVSQLREAHLVRTGGTGGSFRIEPYHDRIREAILVRLRVEARTLHHTRLAIALEQAGVGDQQPRALVRHLEAAGQRERAAHHALRAAGIAADALAFDQAAEFLAIALRIGPEDPDGQRRLRIELAEALENAGRSAEAAEVYVAAAQGAPLDVRLDCQRKAGEQFLISGHIERGREALAAVLAEFGVGLPATPTRALASVLWNRVRIRLRGMRWKDRDEAEIPRRELSRLDVYRAAALGLGMVDTIRGADFQARDLVLALRLGEKRRVCRSIAYEASYLSSQGKASLPRARRLIERAAALAHASQDPYLLAWTGGAEGVVQYFEGHFRTAATTLAETVALLRERTVGTNWEVSTMRIFHLFALRHIGSVRELRRWFDEYARDAVRRGDRYSETTMLRSCSILHLMEDRPEQARAELARTTWMPPAGGYHLQHWYALRAVREIDLYEAQEGRAEGALDQSLPDLDALERSLLTRVQFVRAESRWLRGRLLLAGGLAASAEVKALARALEKERAPYAMAWGRLLAAAVAAKEGLLDRARQLLKSAIHVAEDCDMLLVPAVARRRLGQLMEGSEGRALEKQADSWMAEHGIRNPVQMSGVIAPGFTLPSRY